MPYDHLCNTIGCWYKSKDIYTNLYLAVFLISRNGTSLEIIALLYIVLSIYTFEWNIGIQCLPPNSYMIKYDCLCHFLDGILLRTIIQIYTWL